MAEARSRVEYLTTSGTPTWTKADTDQDSSSGTLGTGATAVVKLKILDKLYSPSLAFVTLFNKSPNPLSSVVDGTPSNTDTQGRLTGVFTSFMQCRIIEEETGLCIFRGRVYQVYDRWDDAYGSVLEIELKDSLAELQDFPLDITPTTLHNVDTFQTANNRRSKLIAKIITQLDFSGNVGTTDVTKFEESARTFGAVTDVHPTFDLSDSKQTALKVIYDLAFADPHYTGDTAEAKSIGYDYYLDPNIISNSSTHVSVPSLNYFSRSSRPGPGPGYVKDPSLNSLTAELPADNWDGETPFKRAMAQDAEFERDRNRIYTSVILTYEDGNETEIAANAVDNTTGASLNNTSLKKSTVLEFEKLNGTITGQFTWAGKNLNVSGTTPPDQLFISGNTTAVATVQFQSGTGANEYLILSDITISGSGIFPTSGSAVTLWAASNGTGAKIVFNTVADRPVKAFGIRKPVRLRIKILPQYDKIRTTVANYLIKNTTETVRGQFSLLKYPYFYIEAASANAQRGSSGDGNKIVFTNNAFLNSAGASGTNNPRDYGVQKGMVIAQVDGTNPLALIRYAYITEVGATYIRYGQETDGTDTSDEGEINPATSVRIYIPLRAGDMMFTRHRISDIVSNQLILEIEHVEEIGISLTTLKSVGNNITGVNRLAADAGGPSTSTLSDRLGTNTDIGMVGAINRNNQAWRFTGTFTSLDNNTVQYSNGALESDDGTLISITGANSPDLTEAVTYDIYYDTGTGFTFTLRTAYNPKSSDIWMGWCKGQSTGGKAILSLIGQRLYAGVDASLAFDEGSLGAALQKKGARGMQTDLRLYPGMISQLGGILPNTGDAVNVRTSSSDHALQFHESATDNPAYIQIDGEILQVGSRSGTFLNGCLRAQQGTSYTGHAVGANIFQLQQFHPASSGTGNGVISAYKELTGTTAHHSDLTTAASVHFADRPTEQAFSITPILGGHSYDAASAVVGTSGTLFGNSAEDRTYFLYCDIPATNVATSLKVTVTQTEAFGDDVLYLGTMKTSKRTQGSQVNVAGASFYYSQTKEAVISAGLISANAIVTDHLSANSIEADKIKAGSIQGTHLQADMILGTNITATADTAVGTTGVRIKMTPTGISGFTGDSSTDATHRWMYLTRESGGALADRPTMYFGRPRAVEGISPGSPHGMEETLRINDLGITFGRRKDNEFSSGVNFAPVPSALVEGKIWLSSGNTDDSTAMDAYYGIIQNGLVFSSVNTRLNPMTFHFPAGGFGVYPATGGTYTTANTFYSDQTSTGSTLVDSAGGFNAGMIGRKITRIDTVNTFPTLDVTTVGIVTAVASDTSLTTSFDGWLSSGDGSNNRKYKLPRASATTVTDFGRVGLGVAQNVEYTVPTISGSHPDTVYTHENPHRVWGNMASYVFEGSTLRLWQKRSADIWSTKLDADPFTLGGCIEFGYAYNANSLTDSYKINFPHPDAEGDITVGQFLKIKTYATSGTYGSSSVAMDGTKDRPYRMELEWADVAVIRSEIDIMTDGFIYG